MSISEIINSALNRLNKEQISSLYGLALAISQSRREAKSILSGTASSLNNAVQADGFGQAVNDSLQAEPEPAPLAQAGSSLPAFEELPKEVQDRRPRSRHLSLLSHKAV